MARTHVNELRVVNSGLCASVQDLGRWHFQGFGVAVGGAMDQEAHLVANALVGNDASADEATIEIAWYGFSFSFAEPALIAITGADLQPTVGGQRFPMQRPVWVPGNRTIQFQHAKNGCYAYLSVAGGFDTPKSLASRATHVRSGIGGFKGRSLQAGDAVPIGLPSTLSQSLVDSVRRRAKAFNGGLSAPSPLVADPENCQAANWYVDASAMTDVPLGNTIQVVRGRHFEWLDVSSQRRLWESEFTVSQTSDRMGYRLDGPELHCVRTSELLSAGVTRGTIQLPAGGSPIVLMADAATTGGYPNIAHVASVALSRLAQSQPGQSIRFCEINLTQAQRKIFERSQRLRQLSCAIALRLTAGVS